MRVERNVRWFALYMGFPFCMLQITFCALMNMRNIKFTTAELAASATLAAVFLAIVLCFPLFHTIACKKYEKLVKKGDIEELSKF